VSTGAGRVGIPFVVAAASGTGKTTVCREVIARNRERGGSPIEFSISHTTRRRRRGEVDGVDYHFVSVQEFQELVVAEAFLEWAVYNENHYGTSWRAIDEPLVGGRDVLLEIEIQGASQVRARRNDARFLFLLPPSMGALEERLRARGTDTPDQIAGRLKRARCELEMAAGFDYSVVNDDFDRCVDQVLEIIEGERSGEVDDLRRRFAPGPALAALRGGEASSR
jgi:guanylate kinase